MIRRAARGGAPLPPDFLDWQVQLRLWTMNERAGAPHAGVAPLLTVRRPGTALGVATHSIICGLLPEASRLEEKTVEFRQLYERHVHEGSRSVYDAGIAYLKEYYDSARSFDPECLTTLLPKDAPVVEALRVDGRCALLFYVFDLDDRSEIGRFRCLQLDARAEILESGAIYDNVWCHNTLFHGPADEHVVLLFRHRASFDTRFGAFEPLTR